jgi:hypothetical protein
MAIAAIGVVVQSTANVRRQQPWYRTAFSVAAVVLAVRTAGLVWAAFGGSLEGASGLASVLPLVAAAVPYFAINSGLVAAAVGLSSGVSPVRCWSQHFLATAPSVFAAAGAVAVAEIAMSGDAYLLLVATAIPMALCHFAYSVFFRRMASTSPLAA